MNNAGVRSQPQALHHFCLRDPDSVAHQQSLNALEQKQEVLQERVSLMESSNTILRNEINFLRGELERVGSVLGAPPMGRSLPSGC